MNYQDMPAGPELDRLIAEKVMGWEQHPQATYAVRPGHATFSPSTNIAHAWEVVEVLSGRGLRFELRRTPIGWWTYFGRWTYLGEEMSAEAETETAPLAICRAALMAVK